MSDSAAVRLREMLAAVGRPVCAAGAHNGLGAVLAERAGYDAVWASSFEISASFGLPDVGLLGLPEFLHIAQMMVEVTALPVIADCDTGFGNDLNIAQAVRRYETAGVAAVCFEDKVFPKVNSFAGVRQLLAPMDEFAHRIRTAKAVRRRSELVVIARTEALIAGAGMQEALRRADAYADAGADVLLIHSKSRGPEEVEEFLARWGHRLPVAVVPTTYYDWTVRDAQDCGVRLVIHANHGLRAGITAVARTFETILADGSSRRVESEIAGLKEVFDLQRMDEWMALEQ